MDLFTHLTFATHEFKHNDGVIVEVQPLGKGGRIDCLTRYRLPSGDVFIGIEAKFWPTGFNQCFQQAFNIWQAGWVDYAFAAVPMEEVGNALDTHKKYPQIGIVGVSRVHPKLSIVKPGAKSPTVNQQIRKIFNDDFYEGKRYWVHDHWKGIWPTLLKRVTPRGRPNSELLALLTLLGVTRIYSKRKFVSQAELETLSQGVKRHLPAFSRTNLYSGAFNLACYGIAEYLQAGLRTYYYRINFGLSASLMCSDTERFLDRLSEIRDAVKGGFDPDAFVKWIEEQRQEISKRKEEALKGVGTGT